MLLDYFGIVRTVAYKYLGTFRREQKKQKRNLKMQIRNCLENHEIRVTCLEKRARSNVRMITTTRMSIKLRSIEKKKKKSTCVHHVREMSKPDEICSKFLKFG